MPKWCWRNRFELSSRVRNNSGTLDENRLLEQVKRRSSNLTLRRPEALEALANFCDHRESNPSADLRFRFVTTASAGTEHGWTRTENGITTWEAIRAGKYSDVERAEALAEIRSVLQSGRKPESVHQDTGDRFQRVIIPDEAFVGLIIRFEWSLGSDDAAIESITHRDRSE